MVHDLRLEPLFVFKLVQLVIDLLLLCVDVVRGDRLLMLLGFCRNVFEKIRLKLATLTATCFHAHRVSNQLIHCMSKM